MKNANLASVRFAGHTLAVASAGIILRGHASAVLDVSFSPDGGRLASASWDRKVRLWDIAVGNNSPVAPLAASATGLQLQQGSEPQAQTIDSRLLNVLQEHAFSGWSVSFSPNGSKIALAGNNCTLLLWDVNSGQVLKVFKGHTGVVQSVSFSPHGDKIASASSDHTVCLWDAAVGNDSKESLEVSTTASTIQQGTTAEVQVIIDSKPLKVFKGHTHKVTSVSFSPDGSRLASASQDKTLRLWDAAVGNAPVGPLAASAAASGTQQGAEPLPQTIIDSKPLKLFKGHASYVNSVSFSPDGSMLASASSDKTLRLWDATVGNDCVGPLAASAVGSGLQQGSESQAQVIVDSTPLKVFKGHTKRVNSISFSPDGSMLASASSDKTVRVWGVASGLVLALLQGHTSWVKCVSFSPDGDSLASAGNDKTVQLWDLPYLQWNITGAKGLSQELIQKFGSGGAVENHR